MMRNLYFLLFLLACTSTVLAQEQPENKFHDTSGDSNTIETLWRRGSEYAGQGYGRPLNFDSAVYFFKLALQLSEKLPATYFLHSSHKKLAYIFSQNNDTAAALSHALKASSYYKEPHPDIAHMWLDIGLKPTLRETNLSFKMACYERALAIHLQTGKKDKSELGELHMSMGDIYDYRDQIDLAERTYLEAERLMLEGKNNSMFNVHTRLYNLYIYKGNLDKAVYYALAALKAAEASNVKNLCQFYQNVGNVYYDVVHPERSLEYYNKALESARATNKLISGTLIKRVAESMVTIGKQKEALAFVQQAGKEFNVPQIEDTMMIYDAMAACHMALKQYDEAEKYYLRMEALSPRVNKYFEANCQYMIGRFYYKTKQYDKAVPYLNSCLTIHKGGLPVHAIRDATFLLYRIDSSQGKYLSALNHYSSYKAITDSIYNINRNRQVEELRIQYDTERKDKELKLKEKDIELLTRQKLLQQALAEQKGKDVLLKQKDIDLLKQEQSLQAVLSDKQQQELTQKGKELVWKQENINLLSNQQQLQGEQLKQANFIKKMTIGGIVLLLVILSLLFNLYRIKQRNNRTISEKNSRLNHLLADKEGLLEEKQLLLKEIHHRVKNNLQVILSLLKLQSANLKDEALAALHDSQHRVQAMSLIHQRLYHDDNISTINMHEYIHELVDYLKDSFVSRTRIVFVLNIEPVVLDVSQAVPLGLIINEAVTNIFKHAFPDRERGQVHISLEALNADELVLDVSDNGIGLPANGTPVASKNSLGLKLMKGLSRDFNGRYSIETAAGTHIKVVFNRHIYEAETPVDTNESIGDRS
ncbi:MAG: tetratricopeptide repeat protein [Niastella sp.]|nr:tetratricopeptide repeat protein [Niastella sp.]